MMTRQDKDVLLFHTAFSLLCPAVLILPMPPGIQLLILVVAYSVASLIFARQRFHSEWQWILYLVIPLSAWQVFPDRFLAEVLGVLVYPEDGLFKFGKVSAYMAGLWTIPLFLTTYVGWRVGQTQSKITGYVVASVLGLVIFGLSEELMRLLSSWYAVGINVKLGHIALYVIPAEIVLVVTTLWAYYRKSKTSVVESLWYSFLVSLGYLGALCFFFLVIEH